MAWGLPYHNGFGNGLRGNRSIASVYIELESRQWSGKEHNKMKPGYWGIVHFVVGLWLVLSPYLFSFTDIPEAYWNAVILGLLFVLVASFGLYYGDDDIGDRQL